MTIWPPRQSKIFFPAYDRADVMSHFFSRINCYRKARFPVFSTERDRFFEWWANNDGSGGERGKGDMSTWNGNHSFLKVFFELFKLIFWPTTNEFLLFKTTNKRSLPKFIPPSGYKVGVGDWCWGVCVTCSSEKSLWKPLQPKQQQQQQIQNIGLGFHKEKKRGTVFVATKTFSLGGSLTRALPTCREAIGGGGCITNDPV